ncbi:MAG: UDP-3-O-(3-hydroxymyristoyl)glucosamine N-acyltransferase [Phormidesmis sp.]
MKFSQIVEALADQVTASSLDAGLDPQIEKIAAIQDAPSGSLSYVEGGKFAAAIETTHASALILPDDSDLQAKAVARELAWVSVKNPRIVFARAIALFYQPYRRAPGVHPTAVIDDAASLGESVAIGPRVVIHEGAIIGDRVCIHAGAVVYPGARIGPNTVLHANCVIHERSQIGEICVIHSGAVIGSEGVGFVPTATGWEKMHQAGITILENGVEIGCNTTVDRPAVGETRVRQNTKIDNLVHIAHGCQIGEAVAMAAQVGMAGGVTIGNRVILAGQVGIANQAKLGDGVVASAQSGIHSNVRAGEVVSGTPAFSHKVYLKSAAVLKKLPEMAKSLKAIQKQLAKE